MSKSKSIMVSLIVALAVAIATLPKDASAKMALAWSDQNDTQSSARAPGNRELNEGCVGEL